MGRRLGVSRECNTPGAVAPCPRGRRGSTIVVTPHIVKKPGTPNFARAGAAYYANAGAAARPCRRTRGFPAPSGQLPHTRAGAAAHGPAPAPTSARLPGATPIALAAASLAPLPQPTAFAQTNVFTFGSAPQSNFARPTDPLQIFYVTLIADGRLQRHAGAHRRRHHLNANTVKLQVGTQAISLVQTGAGQSFPFPEGCPSRPIDAATLARRGPNRIGATCQADLGVGDAYQDRSP